MSKFFADTSYWVALNNPRDTLHDAARKASEEIGDALIVTTDEVMAEFVTYFAGWGAFWRKKAVKLTRAILQARAVQVREQSRQSFQKGLAYFEARGDKSYSLCDCVSMHTMRDLHMQDALTNDRHFEQEGFRAMLR